MLSEGLSGMYIGKMDLNEGQRHTEQGIAQGNTGVGKSSGINDDEATAIIQAGMNTFHQLPFVVALKTRQFMSKFMGSFGQALFDQAKGGVPINSGFTLSQLVQVGSVQQQNISHISNLFLSELSQLEAFCPIFA